MAKSHVCNSALAEAVNVIHIKTYGITVLYSLYNRFNSIELVLPQLGRCSCNGGKTCTLAYPFIYERQQTVSLGYSDLK